MLFIFIYLLFIILKTVFKRFVYLCFSGLNVYDQWPPPLMGSTEPKRLSKSKYERILTPEGKVRFVCDKCRKLFFDSSNLRRHIKKCSAKPIDAVEGQKRYVCRYCAENFEDSDLYNFHLIHVHKLNIKIIDKFQASE